MNGFPVSIKGVLLNSASEVLLVLNDRKDWELPGGRIEVGETPAICVEREFQEELGLLVRAVELLDVYLFEVLPSRYVFIVTYGCILVDGYEPRISDEHIKFGEFPIDQVPQNLPSGYRSSIMAWHAKRAA